MIGHDASPLHSDSARAAPSSEAGLGCRRQSGALEWSASPEHSAHLIAPISQELHCTVFDQSDCTVVRILGLFFRTRLVRRCNRHLLMSNARITARLSLIRIAR